MALISYRNLTVSFGGPLLLDDVGITIDRKERICLLGRNGEGKSTLLRILAQQVKPDAGEVERIDGFRVSKLDQEIPVGVEGTVFDLVAKGLGPEANLLRKYNVAFKNLEKTRRMKNWARKWTVCSRNSTARMVGPWITGLHR